MPRGLWPPWRVAVQCGGLLAESLLVGTGPECCRAAREQHQCPAVPWSPPDLCVVTGIVNQISLHPQHQLKGNRGKPKSECRSKALCKELFQSGSSGTTCFVASLDLPVSFCSSPVWLFFPYSLNADSFLGCAPDPCRAQLLTSLPSSSFPQGSFAGLNCFRFSVSSCLFKTRDFWGYFRGWGVKNSPFLTARCGRRHSRAAAVCPRGCCWKEGAWVQTLSVMQIRSLALQSVCGYSQPSAERQIPPNTDTHWPAPASAPWQQPQLICPFLPVPLPGSAAAQGSTWQ